MVNELESLDFFKDSAKVLGLELKMDENNEDNN